MKDNTIVITTINALTKAVTDFVEYCPEYDVVLVGDKKSKKISSNERVRFLSVDDQHELPFSIIKHLPFNHYGRKNIGYLWALQKNSSLIYDTDDDNLPYSNWGFPSFEGEYDMIGKDKFCNIYSYFSDEFIWPRGFPLEKIRTEASKEIGRQKINVGVWQGLANYDPDVDAIFRLLYDSRKIEFKNKEPLILQKGTYCPFNSQNTLWNKSMLPYAYLPVTVTFRFTDILRGFIAQRCFWEYDLHLGFTEATVYQDRNVHNLLSDFESEIPCYLEISKLVQILDGLSLSQNFESNLLKIYTALVKNGLAKKEELELVKYWIQDIQQFF